MKLQDFDFKLPPKLIAQHPTARRDASRLLVVHRRTGRLEHRRFSAFPASCRAGDVVVANNTRVLPARLRCRRQPGGGRLELLLLHETAPQCWRALARPRAKLQPGTKLIAGEGAVVATIEGFEEATVLVRFADGLDVRRSLEAYGETPLPPYIRRRRGAPLQARLDRERYQTIYAAAPGSAAAPTAGLHFTPAMLERLVAKGVALCYVTLHIGYGTFQPIRSQEVERHPMHAEWCDVSSDTVARISRQAAQDGNIWAVGSTTVRALETASRGDALAPFQGHTNLYIYPGFRFATTDHLLTNFHLPKSSLFVMVCAFAGRDLMLHAYHEAIREEYRFYSFGDAMLII